MNKTIEIIARVPGLEGERIALVEKDKESAIRRLDKAFGKSKNGVWTDRLGQEFFIREH